MNKREKHQISIFDEEQRYKRITELGDPLKKLDEVIDWEIFRPIIKKAYVREENALGGRPPIDELVKFKAIILRKIYNLSIDQTEYQINDRLSFMRFVGIGLNERVLDSRTIWEFEERLTRLNLMEELFDLFNAKLEAEGLITHKGTIIDATFVEVPKQRNKREENKEIKAGKVPEEWQKSEQRAKLSQKDTDARWAKKNEETHYGYKDHVKCDAESKLITDYSVTDASVHDSNWFTEFLTETDEVVYADSAYGSEEANAEKPENCRYEICEKGTRNHPLSEEQKARNREKSKVRCRIEHIFGQMTGQLHGISLRSIGINRAWFGIGLLNLVYNLNRYAFLKRRRRTEGITIST